MAKSGVTIELVANRHLRSMLMQAYAVRKKGMRENYILRAFFTAPTTILGGIFLFIAAFIFGEFLFQMMLRLMGNGGFCDGFDFLFLLLISFGWGALSGLGLLFLANDFWYIYRLMYKDEPAVTFFLVVAANQVSLCLCAAFIAGSFSEEWLGGVLSLLFLGLLYWGAKWLQPN